MQKPDWSRREAEDGEAVETVKNKRGKRKKQTQGRERDNARSEIILSVDGEVHTASPKSHPGPVNSVREKDSKVMTSVAVRFIVLASPRSALGRTICGGGGA